MLLLIVEQARKLNPEKIIIVVGKYQSIIMNTLYKYTDIGDLSFAYQEPALGTGHAVLCTLPHLELDAVNVILNGDTPLLQYETIKQAYDTFIANNLEIQITGTELDDPSGNGRIVLVDKVFEKIVEHKDCTPEELLIKLVNCGIYLTLTDILYKYTPMIKNNNAQAEYYLTDLVSIYREQCGKQVGLYVLPKDKQIEIKNVNTKEQLEELHELEI
jgi:bifunctional N-acetylglucosamine-1-phosphate-uridyltransferase/glucosamine-1-phosphate-acetyltransferase GlmU-like protein